MKKLALFLKMSKYISKFFLVTLFFAASLMFAQTPGGTTINGIGGPFTFTGSGVSCTGYVCSFSGGGSLPTATAANQDLVSTAAGTSYSAFTKPYITPQQYGAVEDGWQYFDGSITSGTASITSATAPFASGQLICEAKAASGGGQMCGTVTGVSGTTATTSFTPTSTQSSVWFVIGTDNTAAFASMLTACEATGSCNIHLPPGQFLVTSLPVLPANITVVIRGSGAAVTSDPNDYGTANQANSNSGSRLIFATTTLTTAALQYNTGISGQATSTTAHDVLSDLTIQGGVGVAGDGGGYDALNIVGWQAFDADRVNIYGFAGRGVYVDGGPGYIANLNFNGMVIQYNGGIGFQEGSLTGFDGAGETGDLENISLTNSLVDVNGAQGIYLGSPLADIQEFTAQNDTIQWDNLKAPGTEVYINAGIAGCGFLFNYFEADTSHGSQSTGIVNNPTNNQGCTWQGNTNHSSLLPGLLVASNGQTNVTAGGLGVVGGLTVTSGATNVGSLTATGTTTFTGDSAGNVYFTPSASGAHSAIYMQGNGGDLWEFFSEGSSSDPGWFGIYDRTTATTGFGTLTTATNAWNATGTGGGWCWTNAAFAPGGTVDSCFSRIGANEVGLGNGTIGDKSGKLDVSTLAASTLVSAPQFTASGSIWTNASYSNGTCTTALTVNPANGNHQSITLTNADTCALTFTQPSSGTITITLKVIQSSAGSFNGGISGCKWPGGTVPTITQTTGAVDFITAYLDGTNAYCVASQNFE